VTDPKPGAVEVKFYGRLPVSPPAPFRIAVLPDTQHYSMNDPAAFNAQTQWIVTNQVSDNIIYVAHEGNLVNRDSEMRIMECVPSSNEIQVRT
jgi:hypothetical protein